MAKKYFKWSKRHSNATFFHEANGGKYKTKGGGKQESVQVDTGFAVPLVQDNSHQSCNSSSSRVYMQTRHEQKENGKVPQRVDLVQVVKKRCEICMLSFLTTLGPIDVSFIRLDFARDR